MMIGLDVINTMTCYGWRNGEPWSPNPVPGATWARTFCGWYERGGVCNASELGHLSLLFADNPPCRYSRNSKSKVYFRSKSLILSLHFNLFYVWWKKNCFEKASFFKMKGIECISPFPLYNVMELDFLEKKTKTALTVFLYIPSKVGPLPFGLRLP